MQWHQWNMPYILWCVAIRWTWERYFLVGGGSVLGMGRGSWHTLLPLRSTPSCPKLPGLHPTLILPQKTHYLPPRSPYLLWQGHWHVRKACGCLLWLSHNSQSRVPSVALCIPLKTQAKWSNIWTLQANWTLQCPETGVRGWCLHSGWRSCNQVAQTGSQWQLLKNMCSLPSLCVHVFVCPFCITGGPVYVKGDVLQTKWSIFIIHWLPWERFTAESNAHTSSTMQLIQQSAYSMVLSCGCRGLLMVRDRWFLYPGAGLLPEWVPSDLFQPF